MTSILSLGDSDEELLPESRVALRYACRNWIRHFNAGHNHFNASVKNALSVFASHCVLLWLENAVFPCQSIARVDGNVRTTTNITALLTKPFL